MEKRILVILSAVMVFVLLSNIASALGDLNINQNVTSDFSEIKVSSQVQDISKIIFGLKSDEPLTISAFIIHLCLWIFLLVVLHEILSFSSLSSKELMNWALAVVITFICSSTGVTEFAFNLYFSSISKMNIGFFSAIIFIIIVAGLFFILHYFIKFIRNKSKIEEKEVLGMKVGVSSKLKDLK